MQNENEQTDLTFKPTVNERSSKIHSVKRNNQSMTSPSNVVERLYKDASDRIEKQMNFS